MAISPDGQMIVTAGQGTARLWYMDRRPSHDDFTIGRGAVGVAFHPDGHELLIPGSDGGPLALGSADG